MKRIKPIVYGANGTPGVPLAKKFCPPSASNSSVVSAAPSVSVSPKVVVSSAKKSFPAVSGDKSGGAMPVATETGVSRSELVYEVLWTTRSGKMHKTYDNGTMKVVDNRCTLYDASGVQLSSSISYSAQKLASLEEEEDLRVGDKELKMGARITLKEAEERAMKEVETAKEGPAAIKVVSKVGQPQARGRLQLSSTAPLRAPRAAPKPFESSDTNRFVLFSGLCNAKATPVEVILEGFLRDAMRPHQLAGVRFLFECVLGLRNHNAGPTSGCILADSMGLGKTLQTIALLRTLSTQNLNGSTIPLIKKALVVVPASLVASWAKEITKWLGIERLAPTTISEIQKTVAVDLLKRFTDSIDQKLLIISYEQVRIHIDHLKHISFGILVCDEGHRLKNPNSKISQDLLSLDIPRRIILTGTPFQNNLSEYYALVDFVNPGALGPYKEFRATERIISSAKVRGADPQTQLEALQLQRGLLDSTSSFILRRTSDVLEAYLPQKHELVVFCAPTRVQITSYRSVLDSFGIGTNLSSINDMDGDGDEHHDFTMDDEAIEQSLLYEEMGIGLMSGSSALAAMTQLSKVCNHPTLLLPKQVDGELSPLQVNITNSLLPAGFDESQGAQAMKKECEKSEHSGKLLVLDQLLTATKSSTNDKFVVVSSFTKTLDLIGHLAEQKGWKFVRLDGSTDISHRNHAVEQFQRDPSVFVFLLSTKAGGVGLNLFAANRLVLFDSCWNPAFDTQAQARVWRDGQTKHTWIYRFLTTGMLDEKIFQRQLVKNEMGRTVLDDAPVNNDESSKATSSKQSKTSSDSSGLGVSNFSLEDLKDIFSVNTRTLCDTHDISGCPCALSSKSAKSMPKKVNDKLSQPEISVFSHHRAGSSFPDPILSKVASKHISFMFYRSSHQGKDSE